MKIFGKCRKCGGPTYKRKVGSRRFKYCDGCGRVPSKCTCKKKGES